MKAYEQRYSEQTNECKTQKELQISEQKFRETIEQLDVAFYSITLDGMLLDHNPFFNSILGINSCQDMTGEKIHRFWENPSEREAYLDKLKANGFIHDYLIHVKKIDGEKVFIMTNSHMVKDEHGNFVRIDGTLTDFTMQKQAEEVTKKSEERYFKIFENIQDVYFETSIDGTIFETSPSIKIITEGQYQRDDLLGKSILELYAEPDERKRFLGIFSKKRGSVIDFGIAIKNREGSLIQCSFSAKLCSDAKGVPVKIIGSMRDITDRKQSEKALHEIGNKLNSVLDNSADAIFIADQKGKYLYANLAVTEMLGYTSEEMKKMSIRDIAPPSRIDKWSEIFGQILSKGKIFTETELLKKDGHIISTDLNSVLLPDGTVYASCRDISKRKLAIKGLNEERRKLRSIIDNLPASIYIKDCECRTVMANKADVKIIGYKTEEEVLGKTDIELYPGYIGQRGYADDKKVISTGKAIIDREEDFIDSDGSKHWILTTKIPMYDEDEKIIGIIGIGHDITERKKAEEELIHARNRAEESDRLKTAFLNNISHEIRTPMNAIVGFSSLLGEPDVDAQSQQEYIDIIQKSSNHLLEIINDIIDVSHIEATLVKIVKNEIDVNSKLKSLCSEFLSKANEKKIDLLFETKIPESDALILTDGVKLTQVLINLINNAIKFTDNGYVKVSCVIRDPFLEFCVSDTGIGIPKEYQKKIFDRFYQVQNSGSRLNEGTGLGLAISKGLVELIGGNIWLTSEPGKGTTFFFTIPYEKQVIETIAVDEEKVADDFILPVKKTILVAEDLDSNFNLIRLFLSKTNTNIIRATNGKEAVEKCLSNKSVDLILMDINMPVMDGYTAVKLIREKNSSIPIIAQTAYAGDREKAIQSGCSGFIAKPFEKNELLQIISDYI